MNEGGGRSAERGPARWLISVGLKCLRVVPLLTISVVIATVVSEASLLLAFLLPLKVIILVGSDDVPAYFPSFLAVYDQADLIPALALCAIGFYLTYQLADRVAMRLIAEGTRVLMARSRKITLFENQNLVAERAFQRYATMLANSVFVAISIAVMWLLYPGLAVLLVTYMALVVGSGMLGSRFSVRLRNSLASSPADYAGVAADIGFLLAFSFMIIDYLRGFAPSVLICIVGIILTRQAMRRSASLVLGVHALVSKRLEISALFFHGQSMGVRPPQTGFWSMLPRSERNLWITELLQSTFGDEVQVQNSVYRQLGVRGVAGFVVEGQLGKSETRFRKLIKIFNTPLRSQAQHEAALLADRAMVSIPAPALEAVDLVDEFQVHVFDWAEDSESAVGSPVFRKLRTELAGVQPSEALIDQFKRSRPMLWDRLTSDEVRRIGLAASNEVDRESVGRFEAILEALKSILDEAPLQFVNLGQSADTITFDRTGRALSVHWGTWSLEPIGSGLIAASDNTAKAALILDELSALRSDLGGVTVSDLQVIAAAYDLVRLCAQQRYRAALEVLHLLLERYDALNQDSEAA